MTQYAISAPRLLRANVQLPASKSISNRALVVSALAATAGSDGKVQRLVLPSNISDCDDTRVMQQALASETGGEEATTIDIMAAGTAMRFLTAYFSATPGTRIITGTERMRHRPIRVLVDALRSLGAQIEYVGEEGFPPLRIVGSRLDGGRLSIEGSVSSQYISALLMIAPTLAGGLQLTLTGTIVSRPYIDMTLSIMRAYGAQAEWTSESTIEVANTPYRPTPYLIENDWSAASYWYEMVALSSDPHAEVTLPGLFGDSTQGDQAVKNIFAQLGVATTFTDSGVKIFKDLKDLKDFNVDFTRTPDLAQTLVVTCCLLDVPFRFTGLQSLRIKETDRIAALEQELAKWGYVVHDADDSVMWWDGERCTPTNAPIDTYDDHRMAMAFATAALVRSEVTINNPQVVSKSYPTFWDTLRQAGFALECRE